MALDRWSLLALTGVALLGCAGGARPIELSINQDPESPEFGVVEVWGLTASVRRALAEVPPDDPRWSAAVTVRAAGSERVVPPLAGRYQLTRDCLRFKPRYRPEGPLTYRVRLDRGALARLAGRWRGDGEVLEREYQLPGRPLPASRTRVTGIFPSGPVVPANQLRWYVEFSAPMREGEALRHVHLLDQRRREVRGAFLEVEEELWDRDRRRLTLLFDMGRVKRAIRTRLEAGPVLHAGAGYTLQIDRGWPDARGAALVEGVEHRFRVGAEDDEPVSPDQWTLEAPLLGSRQPLRLDFGEALDHALAARLIAVSGPDRQPLSGRVTLEAHETSWTFVPDWPWEIGSYAVRVSPALEDLAGNRVGHVFDADLHRGERAGVDSGAFVRTFRPVTETGTR